MARATATIRAALRYPPQYAHYFAEHAALFNRVVAFYFDCIQAHEGILALTNKEALTAFRATQNLSKKSLILLCDVQAETRNRQVLPSPRKPNAKGDHLSLRQGMENATRMAPRTREPLDG